VLPKGFVSYNEEDDSTLNCLLISATAFLKKLILSPLLEPRAMYAVFFILLPMNY